MNPDYSYTIHNLTDIKVIVIVDNNNPGAKSVTNWIEGIVDQICAMNDISPEDHMIVYQDTNGIWDGWDQFKEQFVDLSCDNWQDAVVKFMSYKI